MLPENLWWKTLAPHQKRVLKDGKIWIHDTRSGEVFLQLPENFNIHTCPLLTSMSDQGGINRAGLDYLGLQTWHTNKHPVGLFSQRME